MNIIKTQNLAVGYGKQVVVDGVDIEGLKGQVICLLGPNGSGKTTILRTISGLLAQVDGTVHINGQDLSNLKEKDLAKKLAIVLTERLSPGLLTVFEIASMGRFPHTGFFGRLSEEDVVKTKEALKLVNADYLSERYFNELSDGEKQKVLLARALVQEPELIVLDEPTSHLDVRHRIEVISILKKLSKEKGITVVLSLHDVDLALKICEFALLVKNGAILDYGRPENIIKEDTVKNLYDIHCAEYNELLGSIELQNNVHPSVFVIGGGGTGTRVYRMLVKHGYGMFSGIIHENDVDFHIGKSIGAIMIGEKAFESISMETISTAEEKMWESKQIIDTGYPVGLLNERNVDLTIKAIENGKKVLSLRDKKESKNLYGNLADKITYCNDLSQMIEQISIA